MSVQARQVVPSPPATSKPHVRAASETHSILCVRLCVCACVCGRMHGGTHTHAGYVITGICHGLTHTRYHAEKKRACEIACVKTKHSVVAHTLFKAVSLTPGSMCVLDRSHEFQKQQNNMQGIWRENRDVQKAQC